MRNKSGLFISYARRDGEAFASTLRARLAEAAPDLAVWQDRSDIDGGAGWWRQIEEALERVEFLVVVMTPSVLQSEITRREWRVARQSGVAVYSVRGPGFDPGAPGVPRWMAKIHCYDLDVQWETFIAHLRRGAQTTRIPFMAPPLPSGFVPRPSELATLRGLLLAGDRNEAVAITTALVGAGGFGKTTLAAGLCQDDDILTVFDDGILWATLGQAPNVQGELTRLYAALTGERPGFVSVEDAAQALGEKLENRSALIVIDDVWEPAHLKPFCRGGHGCARLVTTRQDMVAADLPRVYVDEMKPDEALALLLVHLGQQPPALTPFRRLTQRLGEWPLLLKLAGGAMRQRMDHGDSVTGALQYVGKALDRRGVTAFDPESAEERQDAVSSTLDIGLEQLSEADRRRCVEFAIFPENVDVPIAVVGEMWGLDAFDTEEVLARLDQASLVEFDLRRGTVGVHDVMRAYLAQRLTDGGKAAHSALLAAWGNLHALPHGYAWRWVVHHLRGAGRTAAIRDLLTSPAWLQAKLVAVGIYALLEDFRAVAGNPVLDLLSNALRLASHVLARDPSQFVAQMLGRLADPSLHASFVRVAEIAGKPWLRPVVVSLSGPDGALVRTLDAPGSVAALVVSAAGDRIFAGLADNDAIMEWEAESGEEVGRMAQLAGGPAGALDAQGTSAATALVPLDDGRLVVGGARGFAFCDPAHPEATGALVRVREGVSALASTMDGRRVLVGTKKGGVELYDGQDGSLIRSLHGHRLSVSDVAISTDGRLGISGGYDKTARLWDLDSGALIETLYAHDEGVVYAVALSPDGAFALTGAADGALRLWETPGWTLRATLAGHTHRLYAVAFSADSRFALTGSLDRTVKVWDLVAGEVRRTLQGHADSVAAVAFTPDGRRAVSGGKDQTVRIWQLDAGDARAATQQHDGWIHAVALSGDGSLAVSAGQDRTIRLWDAATGRVTRELKGHRDVVSAVAFDAARGWVVSGSHDRTVRIWDLAEDTPRVLQGAGDAINAIALAAAGSVAVTGSLDGYVFVWDLEGSRITKRWDGHRRAITFVGATRHARIVVTGSADGTINVWDAVRLKAFRSLVAHADGVTAGALAHDGRHLLSGGRDGTIRLWSFPGCAVLSTTQAHASRVRSLAIIGDVGLAVSSGYDRYVRVWRFPEMTLVASFVADSAVTSVAASDDGRLILAGDAQGCAHFLRLEAANATTAANAASAELAGNGNTRLD